MTFFACYSLVATILLAGAMEQFGERHGFGYSMLAAVAVCGTGAGAIFLLLTGLMSLI